MARKFQNILETVSSSDRRTQSWPVANPAVPFELFFVGAIVPRIGSECKVLTIS
jgi:hypothetical protein